MSQRVKDIISALDRMVEQGELVTWRTQAKGRKAMRVWGIATQVEADDDGS